MVRYPIRGKHHATSDLQHTKSLEYLGWSRIILGFARKSAPMDLRTKGLSYSVHVNVASVSKYCTFGHTRQKLRSNTSHKSCFMSECRLMKSQYGSGRDSQDEVIVHHESNAPPVLHRGQAWHQYLWY
ncbi:hypothetical protein Pmar_PMAR001966 [Perkinsus marinus ATCC 50983]|uniref:Uncharacterized protein n=1 Tax=Perkinsus marinus (strain ATCC 50983 / TXsc) TaxID=423536 RepID=C5LYB3_PERM5|nr:hypothetical protein Pmar_PMAR001966 [Perkinsus marinus ATCC 50983]EEQ98151.1 hypothetical protein Pmar_PMAR001966 [Perkinsus marinus ATCC 50983]|eukprot:XP_002765434.1 hypothetical protein Pmar_PMAR001966 [Perkinsus marinus ATCC 50983]